jgi:hypothetical protein
MSEPDPPAILRHQVLADPSGRRRRRLTIAGRVATTALSLWLAVLILGGLGLQPLAGLPIVGHLGVRESAPPALPARVQAAVAGHTTVPATRGALAPTRTVRPGPRPPGVAAPPHARKRARSRTTPSAPTLRPTTIPALTTAPAPSLTATSPSTTAPGQLRTETSPSTTAPGQTKTEPGAPTSTPGTTPGANGKGKGANSTVTTP